VLLVSSLQSGKAWQARVQKTHSHTTSAVSRQVYVHALLVQHLQSILFPEQDFSVWTVSVTGHFDHDISVHKQLITFVYLNDYIGRRNVALAGVIPTPFEES